MGIKDLAVQAADDHKTVVDTIEATRHRLAVHNNVEACRRWVTAALEVAPDELEPLVEYGKESEVLVFVRLDDVWLLWHAGASNHFDPPGYGREAKAGCILVERVETDKRGRYNQYKRIGSSYSSIIYSLAGLGVHLRKAGLA